MASIVAQQQGMNQYPSVTSQVRQPNANYNIQQNQKPSQIHHHNNQSHESKLSLTPTTTSSGSSASSPNYLSESMENYNGNSSNNISGNMSANTVNSGAFVPLNPTQHQNSNIPIKMENNNWSAERKGKQFEVFIWHVFFSIRPFFFVSWIKIALRI